MPEVSQEQFDAILDLLDELPGRIGPLSEAFHGVGSPGSRAAEELATTSYIAEPYSLSLQTIIFAGDHAFALRRVLTSPVMTFAPWTLTRGIVEACSQTLWLLDPALSAQLRVARGLNARLSSIDDSERFLRGSNQPQAAEELTRLRTRREHLAAVAAGEGIGVHRKKGRIVGFGETVPTISQIVRAAGYGREYSLLSGVAHQRSWATTSMGFTVVDDEVDHGLGTKRLEQQISPLQVMHLTTVSLQAVIEAMYRFVVFSGWEPRLFAADIDAILDQTILSQRLRPWRR
ncbi:MAG: hypothetical protein Q8M79_03995 [Dehalococcoidia bacterium]|nr:hypothetical protein [Dehalococcoidia bacterium]